MMAITREATKLKKIGLGIIGLGYVGKIHLQHSLKLDNANLVAVADLSKKALNTARNLGVKKTFTNYEQLLKDPDVEAVIIALPTHLHLQCVTQAAEEKKHIFLEKPMARNVTEAQKIISAAQRNSVKLMIGYPLRFNTEFRNLKEKMRNRSLGDIEIANSTYISSGPFLHRAESHTPVPVPEWWFDKELTGGGALIDLGVHIINLFRWYFGEVTEIKAHLGYRFNMDFEDSAVCLMKFETGTRAIINVGWFSQQYILKVELLGSVGHAIVEHAPSHSLSTVIQMLTTGMSKFHRPHYSELQYFANCLVEDLSPSPNGQDGLKDMETISRAYSNRTLLE
jgi:UDP-N-acetylglucosamine 3-dehydrogenase